MKAFDPIRILAKLQEHDVQYVVIGGLAGNLHGSPVMTYDLDICYQRDRDNLRRLAAALRELHARLRDVAEEVPFILDEHTLRNGDSFTFETPLGDFDCLGTPSGTTGYKQLAAAGTTVELEPGLNVRYCSLGDLIRMKRAAGRAKDLIALEHLEELQRLINESSESH
jgi:hypothetical protein